MNPLERYWTDENRLSSSRKAMMEVTAEMLREHYRVPVEIPSDEIDSEWDNSIWLQQLSRLHSLLASTGTRIGIPVPPEPKFGTLPIGSVNAKTLIVPGSGERLVVFNDGLFTFFHLFVKVITLCFMENQNRTTDESHDSDPIIVTENSCQRFHDLLTAYVLRGHPGKATPWLLPAQAGPTQELLLMGCELFALAHEYGHIALKHNDEPDDYDTKTLGDASIQVVRRNWSRELTADEWGATLTLLAIPGKGKMAYAHTGVGIFFTAMGMVERALSILNIGAEAETDDTTHPGPQKRIKFLNKRLLQQWPSIEKVFSMSLTASVFAELLWDRERAFFFDKWTEGTRPARQWNILA